MHRYLQRTVPVATVPLNMSSSLSAEFTTADAAPLLESRFLHRLRAELYRKERAEELRADTAKRVIKAALRHWVQARRLLHRHLSLYSSVKSACEFNPLRAAELDAALCSIQASLRMYGSHHLVEARRAKLLQQTAVRVLERAWRRTPHYAASIRHINDRHMREVLCRQETVERRDLLLRHLLFMIRCHQTFFNDPRMWDAGVAIRRIPLYTQHGLLSTEGSSMAWGTAVPLLPLPRVIVNSVAPCGDAVAQEEQATASPRRPETSPLSATDNANGSTSAWGSPVQSRPSLLANIGSSSYAGKEEGDGRLDIDEALRLCEYRLVFSPEERQLLEEVKASLLYPTSPLFSSDAEVRRAAHATAGLMKSDMGALAASPGELQVASAESAVNTDSSLSYAAAFASALTFIRRPRIFDASRRCTVQHLRDIRSNTLEMQQQLRAHGYVSAALVAPFLRFGLHYQGLARGDTDLSCFTTTAGMRTCRPLVAGRVACAATELRRCLVGAVQGLGGTADSVLPVVLEEQKCRLQAVARMARQRPLLKGMATSTPSELRAAPTAGLMRDGFANPATEALCNGPAKHTQLLGVADLARASSHTASRRGSAVTIALVAEGSRRLTTSTDVVGPYWREFLFAKGVDAFVTAARKQGEAPGKADAAYQTDASSLSPPLPKRVRRGLESRLLPGASSFLLRDFTPSLMRCHPPIRAGPPPHDAATGAVALAIVPAGTSSSLLSMPTSTMTHPAEWWDAMERLLLQEYTDRTELLRNEAVQHSSIDALRRMTPPSVYESVAGA
ncbi:hypothetical protein MNV84_07943 [Leishmania braziliensis]|nr:hypothetical protein MNV84_07943 [Leishmania braziliensis]